MVILVLSATTVVSSKIDKAIRKLDSNDKQIPDTVEQSGEDTEKDTVPQEFYVSPEKRSEIIKRLRAA